jgi:NAD(P)H-hydrate epimerase
MKVFNTKEIREIDAYTIANEPVSSIDLMERAATGCALWISKNIPAGNAIDIFTGPGNNGGDGWAIARILADNGYASIRLFHLDISELISPDSEINRKRLLDQNKVPVATIKTSGDFPLLQKKSIVVDALFGSGLSRKLEGLSAGLVNYINQSGCRVISVDIPSGLFGEDNSQNSGDGIIHAADTLTFEFPKRAFFYAENEQFTGKWHLIPIGLHQAIKDLKETEFFYTVADDIRGKLRKRKVFSHKGSQGHALLIAGSYGMMGAAILSARSCLRTGTGLLTTHVPKAGYPVIQIAVPESIYSIDHDELHFTSVLSFDKFSAVGAGPGLGTDALTVTAIENILKNCKKPLVLDADALNIIAETTNFTQLLPENTILTPHPGEFDRLAGKSDSGYLRNQRQIEFSIKNRVIVVLKGAYTSVTLPDGKCYFNSTGNPGMATAGAGDVLTGIILSLLAQGYTPPDAAILGVFTHGFAGDIAASGISGQNLIASDITDNIGNAFKKIMQ